MAWDPLSYNFQLTIGAFGYRPTQKTSLLLLSANTKLTAHFKKREWERRKKHKDSPKSTSQWLPFIQRNKDEQKLRLQSHKCSSSSLVLLPVEDQTFMLACWLCIVFVCTVSVVLSAVISGICALPSHCCLSCAMKIKAMSIFPLHKSCRSLNNLNPPFHTNQNCLTEMQVYRKKTHLIRKNSFCLPITQINVGPLQCK